MKTTAFLLLLAAFVITALTSCVYTGPPITGSLTYKDWGVQGTIHPTK